MVTIYGFDVAAAPRDDGCSYDVWHYLVSKNILIPSWDDFSLMLASERCMHASFFPYLDIVASTQSFSDLKGAQEDW
jgi:hypothetical protein